MDKNIKKKKILMISDHPLSVSGVGTQARYIISSLLATGEYTFRCFGAAMKHVNYDVVHVNDDFIIKPIDGFGTPEMLRETIAMEKPDAVFIFTDPRFFVWLWEVEDEIHQVCPIVYWHVWDNDPFPAFNSVLYESTDLINCLSYKTYELVKEHFPEKTNYIPHALPKEVFFPLPKEDILKHKEMSLGKSRKDDFVLFWVNRNARRKMPNDILASWKLFLDNYEKKHGTKPKATLLMHTDPLDQEGPNLYSTVDLLKIVDSVVFSVERVSFEHMNVMHNISDAAINISCFPSNTRIIAENGLKQISQLQKGMKVLTHEGRYMPVKQVFNRKLKKTEKMLNIKIVDTPAVKVTGEHPLLVIPSQEVKTPLNRNIEQNLANARFIRANQVLPGDFVVLRGKQPLPEKECSVNMEAFFNESNIQFVESDGWLYVNNEKICKKEIKLDQDLAKYMGRYISTYTKRFMPANKSGMPFRTSKRYQTTIYKAFIEKSFGLFNITNKATFKIVQPSTDLIMNAHNWFMSKLINFENAKRIPTAIFESSEDIKLAFLHGLTAGSGIEDYKDHHFGFRTLDEDLVNDCQMLCLQLNRDYKIHSSPNDNNIQRYLFRSFNSKRNVRNSSIMREVKGVFLEDFYDDVYNIEVEGDNSYAIMSMTVHNCNEGFGLGTLESMQTGKPIIALKTGGLTRQVVDHRDGSQNGIALDPDARDLVGSQNVPFIYEDHVSNEKVADAILKMYEMSPEEREKLGQKAKDYVNSEFVMSDVGEKWHNTLSQKIADWRSTYQRHTMKVI